MTKKFINIFVLLVFAIQVLPVKQMGSLLLGNQITEDIVQDADDIDGLAKDCCCIAVGNSEFIAPYTIGLTYYSTLCLISPVEISIVFPHNHSTDIYSPPPNSYRQAS